MVIDVESFAVAGVVVGGTRKRVQLLDRDAFALYLADLPEGLCLEITITADDRPSSPRRQQLRYWWAVVVPACAKYFGTTDRQMSRDLLSECFGFEHSVFDQLVPARASLSALSADEMSHLIEWVREITGRTVEIPVPDKDWRRRGNV